jgi:nucleoid DNA-binding protein
MWKQIGLKYKLTIKKSDVENNKNMETMDSNQHTGEDRGEILVYFKTKRKPKLKPGSELSEKVNKANIIFDDFSSEKHENFKVKVELITEGGEILFYSGRSKRKTRFKAGADLTDKVNLTINGESLEMKQGKNKTRFKAGSDLTEKVNEMEIFMIQEIINDKFIFTIDVKIK